MMLPGDDLALGTVLANTLVRADVPLMRICDRDGIEISNRQRQVLCDQADIGAELPSCRWVRP